MKHNSSIPYGVIRPLITVDIPGLKGSTQPGRPAAPWNNPQQKKSIPYYNSSKRRHPKSRESAGINSFERKYGGNRKVKLKKN